MIRVRFAPSPTGLLFVSGARVALANDLFARRHDGQFLLRLDDLDAERCRPAYAEQIMQDLQWFGTEWHSSFRQSDRRELYQEAISRLQRTGRLYPCFESEEELRAKQEFRRKRNQPMIYDRAMLALTDRQRAAAEAGGKRPHWRFRLSARTLTWRDLILGDRQAALATVSDPVLVRADGSPAPILASVADDIATAITHIIRGEDNADNTAVQIELLEALTAAPAGVRFAHLPSLDPAPVADKARVAKRRAGSLTLRGLRNDGVEPCAIVASMIGLSPAELPLAETGLARSGRPLSRIPADATQNSLTQTGRAQAGVAQTGITHPDIVQPGITRTVHTQTNPAQTGVEQNRGTQTGFTGPGLVPPVVVATGLAQANLGSTKLREIDPGQRDPLPRRQLARQFDLASLAAAGFDAGRMLAVNRRVLRGLDFAAVADRLPGGATEAFWLAVRGSLDLLREARGWWDVVAGTIIPPVVEGERDLLEAAEALLPPEPWDGTVWTRWIAALERTTGRVGNALLLPLRLALTGEESGPDLADLLPLIGRSRAASRLHFAAA